MTFALRGTPGTLATGSGGSVAPTIGATAAQNLLICLIAMPGYTAAPTFTFPASWVRAGSAAVNASGACSEIWYLANCAASITSVSITYTGGTTATGFVLYAWLAEYTGGATISPLDQTGTKTGTASPEAIAASGTTTSADDLAVTVSAGYYSSATKDTINDGAGFLQQGFTGQGVKQQTHAQWAHKLDCGAIGSTITDSVSFTGPFTAFAGSIALFMLPSAGPAFLAPAPLVVGQAVPTAAAW